MKKVLRMADGGTSDCDAVLISLGRLDVCADTVYSLRDVLA